MLKILALFGSPVSTIGINELFRIVDDRNRKACWV